MCGKVRIVHGWIIDGEMPPICLAVTAFNWDHAIGQPLLLLLWSETTTFFCSDVFWSYTVHLPDCQRVSTRSGCCIQEAMRACAEHGAIGPGTPANWKSMKHGPAVPQRQTGGLYGTGLRKDIHFKSFLTHFNSFSSHCDNGCMWKMMLLLCWAALKAAQSDQ